MTGKRSGARGGARRAGAASGTDAPDAAGADEPARALAELPPWLADPAARLRRLEAAGRLPHALLLAGARGIGKRAFGHWLAETMLCLTPTEAGACGTCGACRQLLAGAHPDYRELRPEGAGIRIDAVRELMAWQQLSTPEGRWRVALLEAADTLNRNAANALLKTLEEPADGALLLLVADRPGALPATVRSRCQRVTLGNGDRAASLAWLEGRLAADDVVPDDGPPDGPPDGSPDGPPGGTAAGPTAGRAARALARSGGAPFAALALAGPGQRETDALIDAAWLDLMLHRASVGRIADSLAELPAGPVLAGFAERAAAALRHAHGAGPGASAATSGTDGASPAEDAGAHEIAARVADRLHARRWFELRDRVERLYRIDGPSFRTQAVLEGLLADIRLMLTAEGGHQ